MKNIILVCAAGMSTSILVKKMRQVAEEVGKEVHIEAMPKGSLDNYKGEIDCILVGPQISYLEDEIRRENPNIPVEVINSVDYGMVDGKKVLKRAYKLMAQ